MEVSCTEAGLFEQFDFLPEGLLHLIAIKIDSPKDLCALELANKLCR